MRKGVLWRWTFLRAHPATVLRPLLKASSSELPFPHRVQISRAVTKSNCCQGKQEQEQKKKGETRYHDDLEYSNKSIERLVCPVAM
jgi:hypothetical protein